MCIREGCFRSVTRSKRCCLSLACLASQLKRLDCLCIDLCCGQMLAIWMTHHGAYLFSYFGTCLRLSLSQVVAVALLAVASAGGGPRSNGQFLARGSGRTSHRLDSR